MHRYRCPAITLSVLSILFTALPHRVFAGGAPPAGHCPTQAVCDSQLGVQIRLQPGWVQLAQVPISELDFAIPGNGEGYIRFVIRGFGISHDRSPHRAVEAAAADLAGPAGPPFHIGFQAVAYGGASGVMLTGVPGGPTKATDVVLVHNGDVYLIILPGNHPGNAQLQALSSLIFIPRHATFPVAIGPSYLNIQPNPVALGQRLYVRLAGGIPNALYFFTASPLRGGFGGGNLGSHRADAEGMVWFGYAAFARRWEIGRWTIRASIRDRPHHFRQVATIVVTVRP